MGGAPSRKTRNCLGIDIKSVAVAIDFIKKIIYENLESGPLSRKARAAGDDEPCRRGGGGRDHPYDLGWF
jgi:hypothetical protein